MKILHGEMLCEDCSHNASAVLRALRRCRRRQKTAYLSLGLWYRDSEEVRLWPTVICHRASRKRNFLN
jgi:hypothetical protein